MLNQINYKEKQHKSFKKKKKAHLRLWLYVSVAVILALRGHIKNHHSLKYTSIAYTLTLKPLSLQIYFLKHSLLSLK